MRNLIKYLLKEISVEEIDGKIIVSGIRAKLLLRELKDTFGSRIEKGMIFHSTYHSISIPLFFAYDFLVVLECLHRDGIGRWFNRKLTERIIEEFKKTPTFLRTLHPPKASFNRDALKRFSIPPLKHQSEFFDEYEASVSKYGLNGFILGAEPGTGKTLAALYMSEMLEEKVTIILAPSNSLNEVWKPTITSRFNKTPSNYVYSVDKFDGSISRYMVFSHDNVGFALDFVKKNKRGLAGKTNIVVDESHSFSDLNSGRTGMLIEMCKTLKCENVLFMSGTPFKALGAEIQSFLYCADPLFNERNRERFRTVFGVSGNRAFYILTARIGRSMMNIPKSVVVKNERTEIELRVSFSGGTEFTMDVVKQKMQKFVEERVKYYSENGQEYIDFYFECLTAFQEKLKSNHEKAQFAFYRRDCSKIRATANLMLVNDQIKSTNKYEKDVIIPTLQPSIRARFRECKSVFKYVSLKIQGETLGRVLGKERERCIVELFKNIDSARAYCPKLDLDGDTYTLSDIFTASSAKAIFFTDYVAVVKEAETKFKSLGMDPKAVYGETNGELSTMVIAMRDDPNANPFIATYKSLSTAVPLTMLDTCVFLNAPFRDYIRNQAESRLDRLDQKNSLFFYSVFLDTGDEPNISTRSKDIMQWSKEMVEKMLGISSPIDSEAIESEVEGLIPQAPEKTATSKAKYVW